MGAVSFGWRLGFLGVVFVSLLSLLSLRMWQLQVTEGEIYEDRAENNQIAFASTPAPRGEIRDANGVLLAGTRPALAAIVDGQVLLDEDEESLVPRLTAFTGMASADVQVFLDNAQQRGARLPIVTELTEEQALFLVEHGEDFPGVTVEPQPIRIYPQGELASDVIGYIGKPQEDDIEAGALSTDLLGRAGLERQYDAELQGTPGTIKYVLNARRKFQSLIGEDPPEAGSTLKLTIDADLQRVLSDQLADGLELSRKLYHADCTPGEEGDPLCPVRAAGIVMDPRTGAVLAMASVPTYDPNIFVGGITQEQLDALPEAVFNNFVIQGQYAPASTFKAVTYFTAFEEGIPPASASSLEETIDCSATLRAPFIGDESQQVWNNWTGRDDGPQNIHRAFMRSCNVYFWEIALRIWDEHKNTDDENLLQNWAYQLGFGAPTGIDLPFERQGIIPDRALFELWADELDQRLSADRLELASPWLGGDLLQAAVGQGAVTVTPLQLANAYAAMVNGGTLWEPYVVDRIEDSDGNLVEAHEPTAIRQLDVDPTTVLFFRRDLQAVVNGAGGTAAGAFADFGDNVEQVGGKTGTAEVIKATETQAGVDTALFVGVAPMQSPRYVVVIVIERGGSGGRVAAPTAKPILQYLLNGPAAMTPIVVGEETD